MNTYAYVSADPVNYIDHDGLRQWRPNGRSRYAGANTRVNRRAQSLQARMQSLIDMMTNLSRSRQQTEHLLERLAEQIDYTTQELQRLNQGYFCVEYNCPWDNNAGSNQCLVNDDGPSIGPSRGPENGCTCKTEVSNSLIGG